MMAHAARHLAVLLAALACSVPNAMGQASSRDLLMINPDRPDMIAPPPPSDEETPAGAVVNMPDFEFSGDEPVTLVADEIGYDQKNAIVVARGNVEVMQGAAILNAQQLVYFQRSNRVEAAGDVSMLQPSGDVYFASEVELRDGMKRGVIHQFQARMSDNSVFAANEAQRVNPNLTKLKHAAYTPCNLCKDAAPFWQMKASEVEIDQVDEKIYYENASMEMFGVPMFYAPVFSHPTPDAQARSGFLAPEYSTSGLLGTMVKVPYYWRISPDRDMTITPWYMAEDGALLEGDYRQLTDGGSYSVRFSGTYPEDRDAAGNIANGQEFRGHIYADGSEAITDFSRVGFSIARATDDTYLRRYALGDQRVLFSRLYVEAAQDRNYAVAQGLAIQGLRLTDDPDVTPLVLPTLEGYYETKPYESGLTLHAFANMQSLTRNLGVDQHRLSITEGASIPLVTDSGHVFTATANVRQDIYQLANMPIAGQPDYDGSKTRILPQAALEWRYPLVRQFDDDTMTLEPIMLAVAQAGGGNPVEISNEDNSLIELTDTNLFSLNRMPGLDTVDSGSRVAYGFRSQYLFSSGQALDGLFGQSYNADDGTPFPNSIKAGENISDFIGRLAFDYRPVTLGYRFALDRDSLNANRNEFTIGFSKPWFTIDAVYRALENNRYVRDSEEGILNASMPLSDEWTIYGGLRRDLELDQMIASNAGLLYRNECFTLILQSLRSYTRDRDVEPNTQFTLRVGFKNLGEFGDQ